MYLDITHYIIWLPARWASSSLTRTSNVSSGFTHVCLCDCGIFCGLDCTLLKKTYHYYYLNINTQSVSLCYCLFRYIDDEITASLKYALLSSVLNYNNHLNKSRHGWWPNLCKNWYRAEKAPIVKYWIHFYTPASMKLIGGGVYWFHLIRRSVRPSIRPIDFGQPLNYFPCHQRTMAVNFPALVRQCIFPGMPDIVVCSEIKTRYEYLTYGCSEEIHL